jgi:predicted ferric reductase
VTSVVISGKNLENFRIQPGQFMLIRFLTKNLWWQTHPFSLSKFPDGKTIRLSIKNVGDFTSVVKYIKKGSPVYIDGPYGIFTRKVVKKNKVLLIAGGIGITPVRSLLEDLLIQKKDVVFLYSNKVKEEIVFKNEFDSLQKTKPFLAYYFLSQENQKGFISGRIDAQQIQELVKDVRDRDIFICGPLPMMQSLKNDLVNIGVPKSQIHYEQFSL